MRGSVSSALLEEIIEKIESNAPLKEQLLSTAPGGFFDPTVEQIDKDTRHNFAIGLLHLRRAYLDAKYALASEDAELMEAAALNCQTIFGDGKMLLLQHHANEQLLIQDKAAKAPRREGGKKRGEAISAAAKQRRDELSPYKAKYNALVESGIKYLLARKLVLDQMVFDEIPLPSQPIVIDLFPKPEKSKGS
jgi:hypothetical protein